MNSETDLRENLIVYFAELVETSSRINFNGPQFHPVNGIKWDTYIQKPIDLHKNVRLANSKAIQGNWIQLSSEYLPVIVVNLNSMSLDSHPATKGLVQIRQKCLDLIKKIVPHVTRLICISQSNERIIENLQNEVMYLRRIIGSPLPSAPPL